MVFNKNRINTTHIATLATPMSFGNLNQFHLINKRKKNRPEVNNETISKLNNCDTDVILPPHKKSNGT